jgi:MoaA/NifB/PqqE/SkfB family radical SAM enzyme
VDNQLMVDRNYEFKFQRGTLPYRAFATWNIHYACNYKCTYCHAPKPEQKDTKKVSYISGEKWLNIWSKIYDKYGTWEILISGGEPFVYPGFMELLLELSKIHIISVCTNLEWDVTYFIKYADAKRIKIETSFHPEFAELDKFSEKLKLLKENGFLPTVNFVPWPPFLSKIQEIKEKIESVGCILTLQPFIGTFSGREYPQGYTEEERGHFRIFNDECNLKTLGLKTTSEANSTKGRLCRMGQNYVYLHPDGQTSRCCRDHSFSLGNIIDGSFKLLEEAAICNAHNCNCWRAMLVDKEDFWWRHWGRYEITDLAMSECKKNMAKDFRIALLQPPSGESTNLLLP